MPISVAELNLSSGIVALLVLLAPTFAWAAPDRPPKGPTETYKGRTLVGTTYPKRPNKTFFTTVRKAIDLIDELPPDLRRLGREVRLMIYDPPSPERPDRGVDGGLTTLYKIEDFLTAPAPVFVHQNLKFGAPIDVASGLVVTGLSVRWHRRALALRGRFEDVRGKVAAMSQAEFEGLQREIDEYQLLMAYFDKTDLDVVRRFRCAQDLKMKEAYEAWKLDRYHTATLNHRLLLKRCYDRNSEALLKY